VRENERFSHSVRQILTSAGVQNGSQISIDFDPSYETLTLHWVRIWRGTNSLDRFNPEKIKVIQRERDLDRYLINGEQSAVFLLDDVRTGDIVDYAYTIRGVNPIAAGKFFGSVPVQFSEPMERIATRLLWPGKTRLYTKNHGTTAKPIILRKEDCFEFVWDFRNVPGLRSEDSLPVWYQPEPWVQLSEFATWGEVNLWAMNLFKCTTPLSNELTQKINLWRRTANKQEQVLSVLQFLQDEVRYLGIEIGENSHQPSDPSAVFQRRFGDCKDKALLFVTILRALGVEAYPVLVNTESRHTLDDWQPTAFAFDHVIAQVRLGAQTYWVDPTRTYQSGPLAARYLPNYERGLVVRPGTTSLTALPKSAAPKRTVTEYFNVRGKSESADLKVITVAEGAEAEGLRAQFATTTRDEIEKQFLNFYASLYPGIRQTSSIVFVDDARQNKIQVTENYVINEFWRYYSEDKAYRCQFAPHNIESLMSKPAVSFRTMPLGLPFPQHQIYRAEILLPRSWPTKSQTKVIEDPAFFFRSDTSTSGRKTFLNYEYRSLADSVSADQVSSYIRRLDESQQYLGDSLIWY
jgi:transglutaminase-like putative cysteine protease